VASQGLFERAAQELSERFAGQDKPFELSPRAIHLIDEQKLISFRAIWRKQANRLGQISLAHTDLSIISDK
jgi:hypothetical protein